MPIRLLCFKPHGESGFQIYLLERGAVYAHLVSMLQGKMHSKEFLPKTNRRGTIETDQHIIKRLIPKYAQYAILSHTWLRSTSGEVTYNDFNTGTLHTDGPGYQKLVNFCKAVWTEHRLAFGWMDTVCINKESSSELDESIRSMYNWYSRAAVCIVYLAETETLSGMHSDPWFTRGWTLQELVAPRLIKFYNSDWNRLVDTSDNDKKDTAIVTQIEQATTISQDELDDIHGARISRRMQLAATREVTREEDTSYSLMGIFNISISTAYGEGAPRAFSRLLQEILVSSTDVLEILDWAGVLPVPRPFTSRILPPSPEYYINRSTNEDLHLTAWPIEPLTLSHMGLRVSVILMPGRSTQDLISQRESVGDFNATVHISPVGHSRDIPIATYHLLDHMISGRDGRKTNDACFQITVAVFNFTGSSDIIILPKTCIGIGLNCSEAAGAVSSTGLIDTIETKEPIVFDLCRRTTVDEKQFDYEWAWGVETGELAKHGMQLVSLYL